MCFKPSVLVTVIGKVVGYSSKQFTIFVKNSILDVWQGPESSFGGNETNILKQNKCAG